MRTDVQVFFREVSFSYSDAVPILVGVDLHLVNGGYGLVGANGAGKSTLLSLIAGRLEPADGQVRIEPAGAAVTLCEQAVEHAGEDVSSLAWRDDRHARRIRDDLDLEPGELERWATLSPGERKRWQIGGALAAEPDVLLLDEPTNHLDVEARERLLVALARFRGLAVYVSHDRELLERLTERTIWVHGGHVTLYPESYDGARRLRLASQERAAEVRRRHKQAIEGAEERLDRARRERAAAERSTSTRHRSKGRHDHDARSAAAKTLAGWGEARLGRTVEVARAEVDRLRGSLPDVEVERELGRSVFVDWKPSPKPRLLSLDAGVLKAGERPLLEDVHLWLDREDRVHLVGPNGAGKTTLLTALLERPSVARERLLYLPQEWGAERARAELDALRALPKDRRGRTLSVVAALGVDADRLLQSEAPSLGESRKLAIARALAEQVVAVILDEPTNHLDLPSVERLESALRAFPGAVLVVSHDDRFAARVTSSVWRIGPDRHIARAAPVMTSAGDRNIQSGHG